ncbi:hypothetical protein [Prosthecobacter dejongeii]|uniref:Uncharacterized protein n=1 Tax=Prosthecobacter dejongeii TaxID=48465 RepID=A0A7W7YMB1_9BACT|nr:hypothetical protein [Prosthecobacter dejongeii]MBB5038684.1 hypothetical protein [Prosthecobacter dejongeii]
MRRIPCFFLLLTGLWSSVSLLHAEVLKAESIEATTNVKAPDGSAKIDFKEKTITANGQKLPLIKKPSQDKVDLTLDAKQETGTLKLTMDGHTQTVPLRPAGIEVFEQGLGMLSLSDTCLVLGCTDPATGYTGKALRAWVGSQSEQGFQFRYFITQVTNQHFLMRMESGGSDGGAQVTQKFEWFLTRP